MTFLFKIQANLILNYRRILFCKLFKSPSIFPIKSIKINMLIKISQRDQIINFNTCSRGLIQIELLFIQNRHITLPILRNPLINISPLSNFTILYTQILIQMLIFKAFYPLIIIHFLLTM